MVPAPSQIRESMYLFYCVVYINLEEMYSSLLAMEKIRYLYCFCLKRLLLSAERNISIYYTFFSPDVSCLSDSNCSMMGRFRCKRNLYLDIGKPQSRRIVDNYPNSLAK